MAVCFLTSDGPKAANAALIAEAPAMYALLERIAREWDESETGQIDGDAIEQAQALLARHQS